MDTHHAARSARGAARSAADHPALEWTARAGFIMNGVLHLLIGWIAIRIATGTGGEEASNTGALAEIASAPGGRIMLWVGAAAFVALAIWQFIEAAVRAGETKDRVTAAVKAVIYLALGITTATFARGGSSSNSSTSSDTTAGLLGTGAGKVVLVVVGLVLIGVGVYHVYTGATRRFMKDLKSSGSGRVGDAMRITGMAGYIAKGVAIAILGGLVVAAVFTADPEKAGGLDTALRTIGGQPYGQILLIAMGLGIALFGLYSVARAKYTRM